MHDFFVTGIDDEAKIISGNLDKYLHKIKDIIKESAISPDAFKSNILTKMKSRQYYGKEILIFEIKESNKPSWYDGKLYERHMSHNQEIDTNTHDEVYSRFYS